MADKERFTVDVLVETPRGDHNRYVYDWESKAVRLVEVVYATHHYPVDWGIVAKTMGSNGQPLEVLVLVNQPTFPGCIVSVRPIGLLELTTADGVEQKVVAVPAVDVHFAEVREVADLPAHRVREIEALAGSNGADEIGAVVGWQRADEAARLIQSALQAHRVAQAAAKSRAGQPAWKAILGPREVGSLPTETLASTEAERAVLRLPYRFQNYVEQCLVPEERILLHVLRPPLSYGSVPLLRRRQSNEGILVLTDQQLLFMIDVLAPDATYVQWGYLVRVVALERVRAADAVDAKPYPRLIVEVEASGGTERLGFDFPKSAWPDLERAANILRRFTPSPGEQHLRRLPEVTEDRPSINEKEDELGPADLVERVEAKLEARLGPGEFVLSRAMAPAWPDKKLGPRLLALTKDRMLIVPDGDGVVEQYSLSEISSARLENSFLGYQMDLALPRNGRVHRVIVDFDSPSAPRFCRFFVKARQLLATPVRANVENLSGRQ